MKELIGKRITVAQDHWTDWRWQQKHAFRDEISLSEALAQQSEDLNFEIKKGLSNRKLQVTPYYLDLIKRHQSSLSIVDNPLWRQVVPFWGEEASGGYDGQSENWELQHEMKTPICQHKYENRVILRITNTCHCYCQFCFEALRTLQRDSNKGSMGKGTFEETLSYLRGTPSIEEVIFSGGDPLMLSDGKLDQYLGAVRSIDKKILIRLHSRALTFNPFRVTDQLASILAKQKINSFGVHVCHPWELSDEFIEAIRKLQKSVPLIFANIPFIKSVNDQKDTLRELFIELYRLGVKPYYLYHFMPFSPGAEVYKAGIEEARSIMRYLKRRVSNIALPEYVLPHETGKFTVPLDGIGDQAPEYIERNGRRIYRFINWQGKSCEWVDN